MSSWGALSKGLRELRVHICQTGQGSAGVREFVKTQYAKMKTANPGFPFLIREAEGTPAAMTARYDFGVEKSVSLEGKSASEVMKELEGLVKSATK
eukprot:jgi/Ulvmu1/9669/UM055_0007.1